jgi:hypothetical protein
MGRIFNQFIFKYFYRSFNLFLFSRELTEPANILPYFVLKILIRLDAFELLLELEHKAFYVSLVFGFLRMGFYSKALTQLQAGFLDLYFENSL